MSDSEMDSGYSDSDSEVESNSSPKAKAKGEVVKDFRDHFSEALKAFTARKDTYYHQSSPYSAPVPSLSIDGVGDVDVPLCESDAQAIKRAASQAPFGMGDQTLVDTNVRHTWEIDASRIKFQNPDWAPWLEKNVLEDVWKSLDVAPFQEKPRLELYKLLLYEPGSHFLPHQDTAKADGMFATIVVVLPCKFEGAEVVLNHAGHTATIGERKKSNETTILAWYTDVTHQIKPITSGYRLALSYNLIHTSSPLPYPKDPDVKDSVDAARQVLQRLLDGEYPNSKTAVAPFFNYVLKHEYSPADLSRGLKCLKGSDAHLFFHILPLLKELGFVVGLANLTYTVKGMGEREYVMDHIYEKEYELSSAVNEDGKAFVVQKSKKKRDGHTVAIEEETLVPRDPFANKRPDDEEQEDHYTGNDGGDMTQWYHSSVVMFYHSRDQSYIEFLLKGGIATSRNVQISSPSDVLHVTRLFEGNKTDVGRGRLADQAQERADKLLLSALKIGDVELWKRAFNAVRYLKGGISTKSVAQAVVKFTIEELDSLLTDWFESLECRTVHKILEEIVAQLPGDAAETWRLGHDAKLVARYKGADQYDVPWIVSSAMRLGIGSLDSSPIFTKPPGEYSEEKAFKFWMQLSEALFKTMDGTSSGDDAMDVDAETAVQASSTSSIPLAHRSAIQRCLMFAATQWEAPLEYRYGRADSDTFGLQLDRLVTVVEKCISYGLEDKIVEVLPLPPLVLPETDSLDAAHKARKDLERVFLPFLSTKLGPLAEKSGSRVVDPPFAEVARAIVRLTLVHLLGSKDVHVPHTSIKQLGCGLKKRGWREPCKEGLCKQLDEHIQLPEAKFELFLPQHVRLHIANLMEYCKFAIVESVKQGDKWAVVVSKVPEVVEEEKWENRQKRVKEALQKGLSEEDLKKLFCAEEYKAVAGALEGEKAYEVRNEGPLSS